MQKHFKKKKPKASKLSVEEQNINDFLDEDKHL